jgi:cell division FtsZ-interacting protein ZapD
LKNFYDWNYGSQYDKTSGVVIGWRKYRKCGISEYSGLTWLTYQYLIDSDVPTSAVNDFMNSFDFIETISELLKLQGTGKHKSNIYSLRITNSQISLIEDEAVKENLMNQIKVQVREAVKVLMPAHTQLWKIEFVD